MGPEKRLPLALFLSLGILIGWRVLFAPPPPPPGEDPAAVEDVEGGDTADSGEANPTEGTPAEGTPGEANPGEGTTTPTTAPATTPTNTATAVPQGAEPWDEWIELGSDNEAGRAYVHFDSLGGSVREIRLGNYFVRQGLTVPEQQDRENHTQVVSPTIEKERTLQTFMLRNGAAANDVLESDLATVHWEHETLPNGVRFTHTDASGAVFEKTIEKVAGEYQLRVAIVARATNEVVAGRRATVSLVTSAGMKAESGDGFYQEPKAVAGRRGRDPKQRTPDYDGEPRSGVLATGEVAYFGTHNKYFAMLARPADDFTRGALTEAGWSAMYDSDWLFENPTRGDRAFRNVVVEGVVQLTLPSEVGAESRHEFIVYAGPKDADKFGPGDDVYKDILREDLGFFDGIASLILGFLRFLHGIVGNWGWAIILLTLVVRMFLFPLNRRMQTAMARHATKMKRVQPKIDAIKKKYEKDPQTLRQEQARIFQEEGAMPPLGGCLPIFLQIPIFFGLFSALRVAFDLRQQPWLGWVQDLSQPDRLARIDLQVPLLGTIEYFNLLPILMVVMWIGQQKVMPKPAADNEQARQMQKIMMWMPIMFGFFLYNYAAGLSLYMITTSMFGILEMTVIRRIWPIDDTEQPKKRSRFMERLEQLQKQAMEQQEAQRRAAQGGKGSGAAGRKKAKRK